MSKVKKGICMLLAAVLILGAVPAALAAELPELTETLPETTPETVLETAAETLPETLPASAEACALQETEDPSQETQTLSTDQTLPTEPLLTQPQELLETTETVPETTACLVETETVTQMEAAQERLPEETWIDPEEDEWLFTLEEPVQTEVLPAEESQPDDTGMIGFTAQNRPIMLLIALVFTVAGLGTCWLGKQLGGTKFLLRLRGVKTTGTLSQVSWDSWNRAYRCTMTYRLENGKVIQSDWPVLQHGLKWEKKQGKNYKVYYNPDKPKEFDCSGFSGGKGLGTLTVLVGMLLILGAVLALGCVLVSFWATVG